MVRFHNMCYFVYYKITEKHFQIIISVVLSSNGSSDQFKRRNDDIEPTLKIDSDVAL